MKADYQQTYNRFISPYRLCNFKSKKYLQSQVTVKILLIILVGFILPLNNDIYRTVQAVQESCS